MSFKQFYEKASNGVVELNEALEQFYLSEGLDSGVKVSLTSTGKGKIKASFVKAQHPAFDVNEFLFYKSLSSVPADMKGDRELVVTFGAKKFNVKKNLNLEMNLINTDFISELISSSKIGDEVYQDKLKSIAQKYSKDVVTNLLKDYVKSEEVKDSFTKEEIKKYSKDLISYFETKDAFSANFAKDYNKIISELRKGADSSYISFVGTGLSGFGAYVQKFNKEEVGTSYSPISDEDLDFLLFGSAKNTAGFENAWKEYAKTRDIGTTSLKLDKFFLYSEEADTLIEVVYNQDQKDSTPEEMLKVEEESDGEEKEGKTKKYNVTLGEKGRELLQVLGAYFENAPKAYHDVVEYAEKNGGANASTTSQNFKKALVGLEVAISSLLKSDVPQDSKTIFKNMLEVGNINDYIRMLSLAAGVALFKKKIAPNHNKIIFEKMNGASGYRALEVKKMGYKEGSEEFGKTTTADILLSDVEDVDLLKLLKSDTTKLEANTNGSVNVVDSEGKVLANYFAVSLKTIKNAEGVKGGSIGRTQNLAKKIMGDRVLTAGKNLYNESVEEILQINESIFNKLSELGKKAVLSLKELGVAFVSRVAKLANLLSGMSKSSLKTLLSKTNSILPSAVDTLYAVELKEATLLDTTNMGEYFDKLSKRSDKVAIYNRGNAIITKILDAIGNGKGPIGNVNVNVTVNTPKEIDANAFKRQTFHYSYIVAYAELFVKSGISKSQQGVVDSIHTIIDLYAEAIFGATKLPLWRVYSYTGAGSTVYDNAMSKESFSSDKKAKLEKLAKDMIIMNLRGNTIDGHIYIDFLVDVMDDEAKQTYAVYELGYGGSDGFSSSAKFINEFKK